MYNIKKFKKVKNKADLQIQVFIVMCAGFFASTVNV